MLMMLGPPRGGIGGGGGRGIGDGWVVLDLSNGVWVVMDLGSTMPACGRRCPAI